MMRQAHGGDENCRVIQEGKPHLINGVLQAHVDVIKLQLPAQQSVPCEPNKQITRSANGGNNMENEKPKT